MRMRGGPTGRTIRSFGGWCPRFPRDTFDVSGGAGQPLVDSDFPVEKSPKF